MIRTFLLVWSLALILALPGSASAGELRLSIHDGYVSLSARDVPLRQVLLEWERVGGTTFVNRDRVPDTRLTIELVNVPEDKALETLLRSTAGYLAVGSLESSGASQFSRIVLMPGAASPALASLKREGAQPLETRAPGGSGRPPIERRMTPDGRTVVFQDDQEGNLLSVADDEQEPPGNFPVMPPPGQLQQAQFPQGQFPQGLPRDQPQPGNSAGSLPPNTAGVQGSGNQAQPATPKAPAAAKTTPAPGMVIPEPPVPYKPAPYVPGGGLTPPPPPIKPPGI